MFWFDFSKNNQFLHLIFHYILFSYYMKNLIFFFNKLFPFMVSLTYILRAYESHVNMTFNIKVETM